MLALSPNMSDDSFFFLSSIPLMERTAVRILVGASDLSVLDWSSSSRGSLMRQLLTAERREHAMIWACNGRDDTPCCAESSLRRVQSVASGLPCYPFAETLPRRDETQFLKKYERRVSKLYLANATTPCLSSFMVYQSDAAVSGSAHDSAVTVAKGSSAKNGHLYEWKGPRHQRLSRMKNLYFANAIISCQSTFLVAP